MPTSTAANSEPKLAKPGAGLPVLEWFFAKYFFFPKRFRETTVAQGIQEFVKECEKIVALTDKLTTQQLAERRLVPRLQGLEDSSRYWSVAMAMEHLIIVGNGMKGIVAQLSAGNTNMPTVGVAQVKPHKDVDVATIRAEFDTCWRAIVTDLSKLEIEKHPQAKFPHPWFGPLNAREWALFLAPHQRIHRKQIEEILKRL